MSAELRGTRDYLARDANLKGRLFRLCSSGAIHRELARGDHASPVMDVDPFRNYRTAAERNEVTLALIEEVRGLANSQ
ncbi:MAG: hypothetical protein WBN60_14240 [Polyangiales bacterium]